MDYSNELEAVLDLVSEAGERITEVYGSDFSVDYKEDDSPVTRADLLSEEILLEGLESFGYGFLSEESGFLGSGNGRCWVIDPLDGTRDFVEGTDDFSILVGLLDGDRPVLGVVHAPCLGKSWYALRGRGAFVDRKPIKVSDVSELDRWRMLVSRFHLRDEDKQVAKSLGVSSFRESGSIGIKYCLIASGEAELCVYTTSRLGFWDCCAPQVILKEAGGLVFDVHGNPVVYDLDSEPWRMEHGFIGCNGRHRKEILEAVENAL
ncbi:MAG: 3'(2'),5'-bisphosphate nucleotidase CysQ [Candidatus Altiarchaeales archaeon ex4484_2]|nr:MAG: 3'(2'),5'-bisphosphate nucleotidase CysQ [Candidatus Altiarchaeales archaeon ex4484_2]